MIRQTIVDASVSAENTISRRGMLRVLSGAGMMAGLGFHDWLMAHAADLRKSGKSMILLWMDGGPSQFETFNPKPGSANQGPAQTIATTLPGLRFAEYWPRTAQVMNHIALIRSMVSKEAEHDRAIALVRTGYPLNAAVRYPTFGSLVAREFEKEVPDFDLPSFVRIGKPRIATRDVDSGVLGVRYAPFWIETPGQLPPNVTATVPTAVLHRRLALADRLDAEFARNGGRDAVAEKKAVYARTSRFVLSPRVGAFDLAKEPDKLRDAYGRTAFGQGCLLARRLVEEGVRFVEVISTGSRNDQGWDTHKTGFDDNPPMCMETDTAYATLLRDLAERGLLDNTLVVWMGEFGRTPKLKTDGGRDHYPKGWLAALSGGGVRGGQVIGSTDKDGLDVTERPVGVADLFRSFCKVLNVNADEEYETSDQRPIKVVEGGQVVKELFTGAS